MVEYNRMAKRVAQFSREGTLVKIWNSVREAAAAFKSDPGNISRVCRGDAGHLTACGYVWQYVEDGAHTARFVKFDSYPYVQSESAAIGKRDQERQQYGRRYDRIMADIKAGLTDGQLYVKYRHLGMQRKDPAVYRKVATGKYSEGSAEGLKWEEIVRSLRRRT